MSPSSKPGMEPEVSAGVRSGRTVCRIPKEKDKRKAEVEGLGHKQPWGEVQKQKQAQGPSAVSLAQATHVKRPLDFQREAREISSLPRVVAKR